MEILLLCVSRKLNRERKVVSVQFNGQRFYFPVINQMVESEFGSWIRKKFLVGLLKKISFKKITITNYIKIIIKL